MNHGHQLFCIPFHHAVYDMEYPLPLQSLFLLWPISLPQNSSIAMVTIDTLCVTFLVLF